MRPNIFAQSSYTIDTTFSLNNIPINERSPKYILKTFTNNTTIYYGYMENKYFILNGFNINNLNLKKEELKLKIYKKLDKDVIKSKSKAFLISFAVNEKRNELYIMTLEDLFIYSIKNKKLIKKKSRTKGCSRILYDNSGIILGYYYDFHPKDNNHKVGLYRLSFLGEIIDSAFFKVPYPEYTHYGGGELITYNGKHFIIPLFDGFKLLKINNNFEIVDTITINKTNWILPEKELSKIIDKNRENMHIYWSFLDKSNYHKISRIDLVEFSENYLNIRWFSHDSTSKYSHRHIDRFYVTKKGEFKHISSYQEAYFPIKMKKSMINGNFPIFSNNYITHYKDNKVIQFKVDFPIKINKSTTYSEYQKTKKLLAKTTEPIISVWILKYK